MKPRILIVDDENDFCEIMKNYFIKKGYDVSLANTLQKGMELLKETRPAILFLDNYLPDGHGWEAVDQIVEIIPQARIFLVSAHHNTFTSKGTNRENIIIWEKPISIHTLNSVF